MKGLEFFRNVSIGQYVDTGSLVHRLTPATKFFGILAFFAVMFANTSITGTLGLTFFVFALALLARVHPGFLLRGLLPALPFLGVLALLTLVFQSGAREGMAILALGPFHLYADTLLAIALMAARFSSVLAAIALLTSVMSEREVAHGVEDSLSPLGRIGFPVHEFSLMITVALRFVPIVTGELEAIVKAQASRGADFGRTGINLVRKAKAYLPLFVPLMLRTLERAELLVEAMEARCWLGGKRTRYTRYANTRYEWLARVGLLAFVAAGVVFGLTVGKSLP